MTVPMWTPVSKIAKIPYGTRRKTIPSLGQIADADRTDRRDEGRATLERSTRKISDILLVQG
jgi:hypothetical protein